MAVNSHNSLERVPVTHILQSLLLLFQIVSGLLQVGLGLGKLVLQLLHLLLQSLNLFLGLDGCPSTTRAKSSYHHDHHNVPIEMIREYRETRLKEKKKEKETSLAKFEKVSWTHVLEGLFLLFQPLVSSHQLLLGLVEVVFQLLHLFLQFSDLLLSLGHTRIG